MKFKQHDVINGAKIYYEIDKELCSVVIKSIEYTDSNGDYIIPAEINRTPVTMLGTDFAKKLSVKRLILPNTAAMILAVEGFSLMISCILSVLSVDFFDFLCYT